jgi:hypothetical protein
VIKAMAFGALLTLAACGGGGGGDQGEVADKLLEAADDAGIELEADCVKEKAAKLSDDDAQKILDAGENDDPDLSPEGEALTAELFSCVSQDAFIDQITANLPEGVDADCVRDQLEGMDMASLAEGADSAELGAAMASCVSGG